MFCSKCGKEIIDDSNFCPSCGTELKRDSVSQENYIDVPEIPKKKSTSKKKGCLGCLGIILILFIILIIIGVVIGKNSSSSTTNTASNSTKTSAPAPVKKDGLTYDKFSSIQMGSTYDQVKAIVGKEGKVEQQNSTAGFETVSYIWNEGTSNMTCMFQDGALVNKAMSSLENLVSSNSKISMDMFNKINMGISYDDVKSITGSDGWLLSETKMMGSDSRIYHWINSNGSNMAITFSNGAVDSKTQFGIK